MPVITTKREKGSEEPLSKLFTSFLIHDLFIFFDVITDNKIGSFICPFSTSHLLLGTFSHNPKSIAIGHFYNYICLGILEKLRYPKEHMNISIIL